MTDGFHRPVSVWPKPALNFRPLVASGLWPDSRRSLDATSSGGHERHDPAPRTAECGTADVLDAGGIHRARNRIGDEDVSRVGENGQVNHRTGAGGILHMIRLGVGHRRQNDAELAGHGIAQCELRLGERHRRTFSGNDDVKTG